MEKINGEVFKGMLESGCANLNNSKKEIDSLNVFPVPDGDTGTNMTLTFNNGMNEVRKSGSDSLPVIAKTLSRGLLMGARGNSGVILSQIFRGIYQYIGDREELSAAELSESFLNGSKLAYKAVMRPTEGTILTVIREASDYGNAYLNEHPEASIEEYMEEIVKEARSSLDRTPDLLPVLKEANVVDSGGSGLVTVLEGFHAYLCGAPVTEESASAKKSEDRNEAASGYRTEFIVDFDEKHLHSFNEERARKALEGLGNHITLIVEPSGLKLSIHTMTPGEILMLGERYGNFKKVQIEPIQNELNPSLIDAEPVEQPKEAKEYGIISVAVGAGVKKLFTDYRTDFVVSGGQTMNPSTEDIASAIAKVNAKHIFVLPNNGNIVMAAKQAAEMTEGKDVIVLATKSVPQGLSACISFNPEETVENNTAAMQEAIDHVKTGSVTYAIKDTSVEGKPIHEGDYMGILEKDIAVVAKDKLDAAKQLVAKMMDDDSEVVTLLKGEDATDEECSELQSFIEDSYDVDVDLQDGGQPVYSFIIGVE
jgi:DAK2 domain fusion protein YloV